MVVLECLGFPVLCPALSLPRSTFSLATLTVPGILGPGVLLLRLRLSVVLTEDTDQRIVNISSRVWLYLLLW